MRVLLIPGWNESDNAMRIFDEGRHGLPGLTARGYRCALFGGGTGSLRDRIDQLAAFAAGVTAADPTNEPLVLFGYSAGGVLARALVRAGSRERVAAIFQLAAPNAGICTDDLSGVMHRLHFSKSVIEDLDIESDFMQWLNGAGGRWERDASTGQKRWRLDKKPWVMADGIPIFNLIGRVPRYHYAGDGIVLVDSATLDGALPHAFVDDARANHLNLSGSWNPMTLVVRRWLWDDRLWPRAVEEAAKFFSTSAS